MFRRTFRLILAPWTQVPPSVIDVCPVCMITELRHPSKVSVDLYLRFMLLSKWFYFTHQWETFNLMTYSIWNWALLVFVNFFLHSAYVPWSPGDEGSLLLSFQKSYMMSHLKYLKCVLLIAKIYCSAYLRQDTFTLGPLFLALTLGWILYFSWLFFSVEVQIAFQKFE